MIGTAVVRVAVVAAIVVVFTAGLSLSQAEEVSHPPHVERPTADVSQDHQQDPQLIAAAETGAFMDWLEQIKNHEQLVAYLGALETAHQAAVAAQAKPAPAPAPSRPQISSSGTVGSCTGFPISSSIIQRESGGNPNAVNSSTGAYGCAQVMPFWWSGACAGLDKYTIEGQRQCVQIIVDTQGMSAWGG